MARLKERKIFVSRRSGALRISPHVYVTGQDIARFQEALDEWKN
jgi:selenocysteine lyase/cysteine desulfurase